MLKKCYENGYSDSLKRLGLDNDGTRAALARYGLEKTAVGILPTALARGRQFLRGQAGGLGDLGAGLHGMLGPTANPAARTQAWQGLKTLAPSLGIAGGAALLSQLGKSERPETPPMYVG
jgi:hypothetical protein